MEGRGDERCVERACQGCRDGEKRGDREGFHLFASNA